MRVAVAAWAVLVVSCDPGRSRPAQVPPGQQSPPGQGAVRDGAVRGGEPAQSTGLQVPDGVERKGPAWTVRVSDYQTKTAIAGVPVTAVEQTWGCKTRVIPNPNPRRFNPAPPRRVKFDCKGGKRHITGRTDANGSVTLSLPHTRYRIGPIRHRGYFSTDFRDPSYRAIAPKLTKRSRTATGRLVEYWLFPRSALKVKTAKKAEELVAQDPIVKKCLSSHPSLTSEVKKPSLTWRVRFMVPGSDRLKFVTTVNSFTAKVGFLGCWDSCCSRRGKSRFEKRLIECKKLRASRAGDRKRKQWDCDTLSGDFDRLKKFLRKKGDRASLEKYEKLYREYEAGQNK